MPKRNVTPEELDQLIANAQKVFWTHAGREYEGILTRRMSQPNTARFSGRYKSEQVEANVPVRDLLVEELERMEGTHGSMVR